MSIDVEQLREQLSRCRLRNDQWERLENGEWVPWPVLRLDRLAHLEIRRDRPIRDRL